MLNKNNNIDFEKLNPLKQREKSYQTKIKRKTNEGRKEKTLFRTNKENAK